MMFNRYIKSLLILQRASQFERSLLKFYMYHYVPDPHSDGSDHLKALEYIRRWWKREKEGNKLPRPKNRVLNPHKIN